MSDEEQKTAKIICDWAKENNCIEKIEILCFVDKKSAQWIHDCGCKTINLLTKGSLRHLTEQLKKTPEQHLANIKEVFDFAKENNMAVNTYLEDWSTGMSSSKDYVISLITKLQEYGAGRIILADTLGILDYEKTYDFTKELAEKFPDIKFDFHGHNDYGLAVSNSIAAIKAGATGIHVTVNGLGERTGNTDFASLIAAINDMTDFKLQINEPEISNLCTLVESFSGIWISSNAPIVGENVFTQNCGVHADGDKKAGLYQNKLTPERFGKERRYSLGKTSGIASIDQNLLQLELDLGLDNEQKKKVLQKIKELAHKKQIITREDLPFIISDIIGDTSKKSIELIDYKFTLNKDKNPEACVTIKINNDEKGCCALGNGQYDAFMNALKNVCSEHVAELVDYFVGIPPGGKTSALVETVITWKKNGKVFKTRGVDSDQLLAAIEATIKMLNLNND
jgi:D-citramalate synthase